MPRTTEFQEAILHALAMGLDSPPLSVRIDRLDHFISLHITFIGEYWGIYYDDFDYLCLHHPNDHSTYLPGDLADENVFTQIRDYIIKNNKKFARRNDGNIYLG